MDLIYSNADGRDIDIMMAYTLDMAFGTDENNFECAIDRASHCCQKGYYLHVEGEEYGGIVDKIRVNTESDMVTYKGRTWHGVLEGKVLCPDPDEDYLVLDGDANAVLQEIIDRIGLSGLFTASDEVSDIDISNFQVRYGFGYTTIRKMLKEAGGKLRIRWVEGMVELSAVPIVDYSEDDEFDTSQVDFTVEKDYLPVNHLICLGQGDLKDRAVIHLFSDKNGGIQPYATVDQPVQDSQYILDESQKVMTGSDEVTDILDYPGAEVTTNYIRLTSKPADWEKNCENYYEQEESAYKSVEKEPVGYILQKSKPADWEASYSKYYRRSGNDYSNVTGTVVYEALTQVPSDWKTKYDEYYTKNGSSYRAVQGVTTERYIRQTKRPSDWVKKYGEYFVFYSDGVISEYRDVSGVSYDVYRLQTRKPTDWTTEYGEYYRRATAAELKERPKVKYYSVEKTKGNKVPTWKPRKYYTKYTRQKAPAWKAETRYTYEKTVSAPAFESGAVYRKDDSAAPAWTRNTFYSATDEMAAPKWVTKKYYRQATDRYAVMVEEGIARLEEAHQADYLGINLEETERVYDIGDMVGSTEEKTGISATQEVVKKIIRIENDDITISYEVN